MLMESNQDPAVNKAPTVLRHLGVHKNVIVGLKPDKDMMSVLQAA